jgi:hypothetical protein
MQSEYTTFLAQAIIEDRLREARGRHGAGGSARPPRSARSGRMTTERGLRIPRPRRRRPAMQGQAE